MLFIRVALLPIHDQHDSWSCAWDIWATEQIVTTGGCFVSVILKDEKYVDLNLMHVRVVMELIALLNIDFALSAARKNLHTINSKKDKKALETKCTSDFCTGHYNTLHICNNVGVFI